MRSVAYGTACALLATLSLVVVHTAADEDQTPAVTPPEGAGFVRFVGSSAHRDSWKAHKQYVGTVMRDVMFTPRTSHRRNYEADAQGRITLHPGTDFDMPGPDVLGVRVSSKEVKSTLSYLDEVEPTYEYIARDALAAGPVTIRALAPGQSGRKVFVNVRDVPCATRRITTEPVVVPPKAWLDVAVGLLQDWPVGSSAGAEVTIEIERDERSTTLYTHTLHPAAPPQTPQWTDVHLGLAAHAGAEVRFVFASEAFDADPAASFAFPMWGNPMLYSVPSNRGRETPNVILVSLDTLRADHVGCYGYERDTTPNLDRLAGECVVFDTTIAPSTFTPASHGSVFTGLHPAIHEAGMQSRGYWLKAQWTTFAEILRAKGYLTAAFTEGVAIRGTMGFAQGFDLYSDGPASKRQRLGVAEETFAKATSWLDRYGHLPFFLFVHTYETHEPYGAVPPWTTKFADPAYAGRAGTWLAEAKTEADKRHTVDLYDASIAFADHHLGQFLGRVRQLGLLENTVVVVFSDHGEEFWEHGATGHLTHLYDETLRVPLLIRLPGADPPRKRIEQQVCLTDVFPTLLGLFNEPLPRQCASHDLLALVAPEAHGGHYPRNAIVSQLSMWDVPLTQRTGILAEWTARSVRTQGEKFIASDRPWVLDTVRAGRNPSEAGEPVRQEELYDLGLDPGEKNNLIEKRPERTAHLRKMHQEFLRYTDGLATRRETTDESPQGLTLEDAEALRGLGYL